MTPKICLQRPVAIAMLFVFLTSSWSIPPAYAQELYLPSPGQMVPLSAALNPVVLKGIKLEADNPFRFHFFVDSGDSKLSQEALKTESSKLIKYFLASLTTPEKDLWVNLSPYEKDRIVPKEFGQTEMGRDLLAQDYLLKQITASLIYPENELGKVFWQKVYAQAQEKFGTTNIPVNTFNKVWILPEKAVIYEHEGTAFVLENHLKVMLEEDYLAKQKNNVIPAKAGIQTSALGSQIVREIVIPALTKEVNEGKNFAQLRQVFYSLILATWYKKKIKESILNKVLVNRNKITGLQDQEKSRNIDPQLIYQQYLQAFKKGVYNYIKEEPDPLTKRPTPRKYFSGGIIIGGRNLDAAMVSEKSVLKANQQLSGDTLMELIGNVGLINQKPYGSSQLVADHAMVAENDGEVEVMNIQDREIIEPDETDRRLINAIISFNLMKFASYDFEHVATILAAHVPGATIRMNDGTATVLGDPPSDVKAMYQIDTHKREIIPLLLSIWPQLKNSIAYVYHLKAKDRAYEVVFFDGTYPILIRLDIKQEIVESQVSSPANPKKEVTLDSDINVLDLTSKLEEVLREINVHTIGQLIQKTPTELFKLPSLGKGKLRYIKTKLAEYGFYLGSLRPTTEGVALESAIDILDLTDIKKRSLKEENILTIGQLVEKTSDQLQIIRGIGLKGAGDIREALRQAGFHLKGEEPPSAVTLESPVSDLDLNRELVRNLSKGFINLIGQLVEKTANDFISSGWQPQEVNEIRIALKKHNLYLKGDAAMNSDDDWPEQAYHLNLLEDENNAVRLPALVIIVGELLKRPKILRTKVVDRLLIYYEKTNDLLFKSKCLDALISLAISDSRVRAVTEKESFLENDPEMLIRMIAGISHSYASTDPQWTFYRSDPPPADFLAVWVTKMKVLINHQNENILERIVHFFNDYKPAFELVKGDRTFRDRINALSDTASKKLRLDCIELRGRIDGVEWIDEWNNVYRSFTGEDLPFSFPEIQGLRAQVIRPPSEIFSDFFNQGRQAIFVGNGDLSYQYTNQLSENILKAVDEWHIRYIALPFPESTRTDLDLFLKGEADASRLKFGLFGEHAPTRPWQQEDWKKVLEFMRAILNKLRERKVNFVFYGDQEEPGLKGELRAQEQIKPIAEVLKKDGLTKMVIFGDSHYITRNPIIGKGMNSGHSLAYELGQELKNPNKIASIYCAVRFPPSLEAVEDVLGGSRSFALKIKGSALGKIKFWEDIYNSTWEDLWDGLVMWQKDDGGGNRRGKRDPNPSSGKKFPAPKKELLVASGVDSGQISMGEKGGIDFNPAQMTMETKQEGQDFHFNFNGHEIDAAQVVGAEFEIQQMLPVTNLPAILGITDSIIRK